MATKLVLDEQELYELVSCIEYDAEHHGIGVRSVDEQHKVLIAIINKLCVLVHEALQESNVLPKEPSSFSRHGSFSREDNEVLLTPRSKGRKLPRRASVIFQRSCSDVVQQFVTYQVKYLTAEQHMLDSYGYSDRVEHLKEHEKFENEVCVVNKYCQEGIVELEDLKKFLQFMKEWVHVHIPHDKRYAAFMIDKGAH